MKILVIEDEPTVVSFMRRSLMEANHEVLIAMDGETGYQMAQSSGIDFILLDVMLPVINGIDLCRKLREKKITTPIIMISALGMTENIITGLKNGADDYLIKPFKFAELLARIEAVLRRNENVAQVSQTLHVADLIMDVRSKRVSRNGTVIELTATEYKLLEFLLKNEGRVIARGELLDNVWAVNFDMTTNVVDVYINYLRKKIDKNYPVKLIHTVVGMGYVLRSEK